MSGASRFEGRGGGIWTPLLAPLGAFGILVMVGVAADVVEPEPTWLGALFAGVTWGLVPATVLWAGDELSKRLTLPRSRARLGWVLAYLLGGYLHVTYGSSRAFAPDAWIHPLSIPVLLAWPGTAAWLDIGCPLGLLFCPQ